MSQGRLTALILVAGLSAGCGPDVELECVEGTVTLNQTAVADQADFCAACFDALGCSGTAEPVPDCPTGMTGSCSADADERQYCCEGDCLTCP